MLQILAGVVENLDDLSVPQHGGDGGGVAAQRIEQTHGAVLGRLRRERQRARRRGRQPRGVEVRRHRGLDEAQIGIVRALPHEFGVEGDETHEMALCCGVRKRAASASNVASSAYWTSSAGRFLRNDPP